MVKVNVTAFLVFLFFSIGVAAQETPQTPKKWNFLVWMAADNNLDPYALLDLAEMKAAGGSSESMHVTVMVDGAKDGDSKYMHFGTDSEIDDTVALGEIDSGDYKEVVKFVKWASEKYPAEKYMLILWNHGSGWSKKQFMSQHKDIAMDDNGTEIKTNQLSTMLSEMNVPIEVLGYDACLMQMMEVIYEVKDQVKFTLASEESEPLEGWRYDKVLSLRGDFTAEEFLKNAVESYALVSEGDTMSAVDTTKLNAFLPLFKQWATATTPKELKTFAAKAAGFYSSGGKDLGNILEASGNVEVLAAYNAAIVANYSIVGATGIDLYVPGYWYDKKYETLKFAIDFPEWVALIKKKDDGSEDSEDSEDYPDYPEYGY